MECIAFGKSSSSRLRETVDDFIDMDENPREFLIGFRGGEGVGGQPNPAKQMVGTDTD